MSSAEPSPPFAFPRIASSEPLSTPTAPKSGLIRLCSSTPGVFVVELLTDEDYRSLPAAERPRGARYCPEVKVWWYERMRPPA